METQNVILQATQVTKTFIGENGRPKTVLKKVNLTVHEGEFVTILGQSGSGKSTLLRILAGLLFPDSGTVSLENVPLKGPD